MDLVKRLRKHASRGFPIGGEAADEIERLRARVSALEEMGRPFARHGRDAKLLGVSFITADLLADGRSVATSTDMFEDFARAAELIED